ncbi:MAG TPA: carbohydrate ABC transporter permease [Chloroflexota bacterium]|nr:carbohydrate ABC transporter permease [Chloroflexota bacterium]
MSYAIPRKGPRPAHSPARLGLYVFVGLFLLWTLVPLVWMVLSSFRTQASMLSMPPKLFVPFDTYSYWYMFFGGGGFGHFLLNSVIAAGGATLISLALGTLGGYGLARGTWRRKADLSFWIISTRMAPIAAVIVPLYMVFRQLGLQDSLLGLMVAYCTFNLPFAIWIMQAFFRDLPKDLEEAAKVDGCNTFGAFWRVALPLAAPGLVATGVLCLVFAWNDFAFATVFTGADTQTIPVAASQLVTQQGIQWGQLMATATIILTPMVICGVAIRRWLVRGLTMGAISGQ